jgi:hypothetical protein
MKKRQGWLLTLAVTVLLLAACGPQMATPTPQGEAAAPSGETPTEAAVAATPTTAEEPTGAPTAAAELPADPNDWHVLGSADAAATIIEYSDFQ